MGYITLDHIRMMNNCLLWWLHVSTYFVTSCYSIKSASLKFSTQSQNIMTAFKREINSLVKG